jgi:hypothetical protein
MRGNRLVCARCNGLVAEGRCSVCRSTRDRLRPDGVLRRVVLAAVIALLALAAMLAAAVERYALA